MKLVYLAKTRIPSRHASSVNVMKMCQAFVKNGHQVTLMNYDYPDVEPGVEDIFDFYGVDPCFKITLLPRKEAKWSRLRASYRFQVKWRVRLQRPDIVFTRDHGLGYGLHDLGPPVILECHKPIDRPKAVDRFNALLDSKRLLGMVAISEALRQTYVRSHAIPASLIQVAPSGADPAGALPPATLDTSGRFQVGYVGSLYPGKGMETIIELASRCGWADFHIVGGSGPDLHHWTERAYELPNVRFHGFMPHQEACRYQQAVDVLLLPNQRQVSTAGKGTLDIGSWTSPLKLFEYMAAAKPIVASDLPVIREILTHRSTAYLCPPGDVETWAETLRYLRDHPTERARLGQAAAATFAQNYTWATRARRVLERVKRP